MRPHLLGISLLLFVVTHGNCQNCENPPDEEIGDRSVGNRINYCGEFKQYLLTFLPFVENENENENGNGSGDPTFGNQLIDPNLNQQLQNAPVAQTGGQFSGLSSGDQYPQGNIPAQSPVETPIYGNGGNGNGFPVTQRPGALSTPQSLQNQRILRGNQQQQLQRLQIQSRQLEPEMQQAQQQIPQLRPQLLQMQGLAEQLEQSFSNQQLLQGNSQGNIPAQSRVGTPIYGNGGNGNGFPVTQRPGALSTPQSLQNQRILRGNQQQQLQRLQLQSRQLEREMQQAQQQIPQLRPQLLQMQGLAEQLEQSFSNQQLLQGNSQDPRMLQQSLPLSQSYDPTASSNDPGIQQASPLRNLGGGYDGQGADPQDSLRSTYLTPGFVVNPSQRVAANLGQIPGAPYGSPHSGIADSDPQVSRISASGVLVPNSGNGFQPGNYQTSTGVARRGGRFPYGQPAAAERGGGGVSQQRFTCPSYCYN